MPSSHLIPDLRAEVAIPKDGILSRTVHEDPLVKVVAFGFDAGQELSAHTAAQPAIVEILDGEATIVLGDATHEVGPGAWFAMDAGLRHAVRARTPMRMLLLLLHGAGKGPGR